MCFFKLLRKQFKKMYFWLDKKCLQMILADFIQQQKTIHSFLKLLIV